MTALAHDWYTGWPDEVAEPQLKAVWTGLLEDGKLIATFESLLDLTASETPIRIQTINVQHLGLTKTNPEFLDAVRRADYVTADGWPLVMAAKRQGAECEKVTGKALCQTLYDGGLEPRRIAILGTSDHACDAFAEASGQHGHERVFCQHGALSDWDQDAVCEAVARSGADLILVALGAPFGEILAARLRDYLQRGVIIGVGGAIEMVTGFMPMAPRLMETLKLEWAYRLATNPRRLWRRYLVEGLPTTAQILLQ